MNQSFTILIFYCLNHPIGLVTRIGTKQAIYEALLNVSTLNRFLHNLFIQVPKKVSLRHNNLYIE